jgi:hypothetical protein
MAILGDPSYSRDPAAVGAAARRKEMHRAHRRSCLCRCDVGFVDTASHQGCLDHPERGIRMTTVKTFLVMGVCGLVLLSVVAAQAMGSREFKGASGSIGFESSESRVFASCPPPK